MAERNFGAAQVFSGKCLRATHRGHITCRSFKQRCFTGDWHTALAAANTAVSVIEPPERVGSAPVGVRLGDQHYKAQLYSSVRSQTTPLRRRDYVRSVRTERPAVTGRNLLPPSQAGSRDSTRGTDEVRAIQPLFPCPEKRWRHASYSRSKTAEQGTREAHVQDDYSETDPRAHSARGPFHSGGSERCLFSCPGGPSSQALSAICIRGCCIPIQSVTVRAGFGPPYVYDVHECSALAPETQWNARAELSRRLADHRPIEECTRGTQAQAPHPSSGSGLVREHAKEHASALPVDYFSGYGSGLAHDDHALIRAENPVHSQYTGLVCARQGGSSENVSKTAWSNGSCNLRLPAGLAAYEAVTTMVTGPSPAAGLERWDEAPCHNAFMSRGSDALVRHSYVRTGCCDGQGGQTDSGDHGRVTVRLGSPLQWQTSVRRVGGRSEALAHKLLGDGSCSFGATELSSVCERPPCSNPNGQHGGGGIHRSPGRNALVRLAGLGKMPALVGRSGTSLDSSSSCTGQSESREHCSRGVETTPPNSKVDLESLWRSGDRPFCVGRECPLPAVLLTDDGYPERGCVVEPLAHRSEICIPSSQNNAANAAKDQRGEGCCASGSAEMAQPTMVSRVGKPVVSPPVADSAEKGFIVPGEGRHMAPQTGIVGSACVASQYGVNQLTISQRVLHTITEARAPSTRHLYDLKWRVFANWCISRHEDPISCDIPAVLTFLQERLDAGSSPSTLKVYVAAIATSHSMLEGRSIGKNPLISCFLHGARRLNPSRPRQMPVWDLSLVLRALSEPPFEPAESSDMKVLSFKTAVSARTSVWKTGG